jgi:hypothetical protein
MSLASQLQALDEARLDRQLRRTQVERFPREFARDALDLEQHATGLDHGDPELRRALPLPIRVSAGFFVTGLSGNTRIHTLPPRLIVRVIATRAASIWRLDTHAGCVACSPNSPKAMLEPR